MNEFLPFARPCLSDETINEVAECLKSNWLATGPRVQDFEKKLAEYFGVKYVLVVSSATAGLFLSLKALDLKEGDEVITTPLTFVATLNTIIHAGAKPVLVDIDPDTRNIKVDLVEKAITSNTKAIIPVHFAGLSVDMDHVLDIAQKYNLRVIEDAAHAMGAYYNGKKIGSFGDIQVFSFHPCKNMTSAEGGCITTNDDLIASRIKSLRFFGIDRDAWARSAKNGSSAYDIIEAGYKCNMSDLQATIGLAQLEILDEMNKKRRVLVDYYRAQLKNVNGLSLPGAKERDLENSWHIFTVLVNKDVFGLDRQELEMKLKENNIGSGYHYPPIHLFSYFKDTFGWNKGDFIHAENVGNNIISLPLFPEMTIDDCQRVVDVLKDV